MNTALFADIDRLAVRTPTLPPATHTNSYALGGRDVLLVEPATPYDDERAAWLAWARGLASRGRRPVAIFATHHHPDHVGGAAFLADALALPLWAHRATADRIDTPVARALDEGDEIVLEGPTPRRWRVLHTPGHAPGHLCLFDPDARVAIVGDMVASTGTILIPPEDGDMAEYLRQLARLAALDALLALPAHGEPIESPTALFRHYIQHRLTRERVVVASLARSPNVTLDELVARAYADVAEAARPVARLSLESHVKKLIADGRVVVVDGRYALADGASLGPGGQRGVLALSFAAPLRRPRSARVTTSASSPFPSRSGFANAPLAPACRQADVVFFLGRKEILLGREVILLGREVILLGAVVIPLGAVVIPLGAVVIPLGAVVILLGAEANQLAAEENRLGRVVFSRGTVGVELGPIGVYDKTGGQGSLRNAERVDGRACRGGLVTDARGWLDGFAAAAALFGVRGPDELASMLPAGAPLPSWWGAFGDAAGRDERAARLAPHALRLGAALDEARPQWG